MENSEDNVLSSEGEESLASESYDTNDEIEFEELESSLQIMITVVKMQDRIPESF